MVRKLEMPDREELLDIYSQEDMSQNKLAKHYSVSHPTIKKWLKEYDIPIKSHTEVCNSLFSKTEKKTHEFLIDIYLRTNSLEETAKIAGYSVDYTRRKLLKHGVKIPRKKRLKKETIKKRKAIPTKEELLALYEQFYTLEFLAENVGVSVNTIRRWLKRYNIDILSPSEIRTKQSIERYDIAKATSKEEMESLYQQHSIYNIAKIFGIDNNKMADILRHCGVDTSLKCKSRSRGEANLFYHCHNIDDNFANNDRTIISPKELDIVNYDKKFAIEYCGVYWHSVKFKDKGYHQEKFFECREKGYDLYTFYESDDLSKIHLSINRRCGKSQKIHARKCVIRLISNKEAKEFNERYHFLNHINAAITYGLFYEDELVMIMSFGKSRYDKSYEWELYRMTSREYIVNGGASKLFSHFIKDHDPISVLTYANLRFGIGTTYEKLGFEFIGFTSPNFNYIVNGQVFSRVSFMKHKLKDKIEMFDPDKTEEENMAANNHYRIYDCGNAKYVWTKKGTH